MPENIEEYLNISDPRHTMKRYWITRQQAGSQQR
jgi:hypothetical protein